MKSDLFVYFTAHAIDIILLSVLLVASDRIVRAWLSCVLPQHSVLPLLSSYSSSHANLPSVLPVALPILHSICANWKPLQVPQLAKDDGDAHPLVFRSRSMSVQPQGQSRPDLKILLPVHVPLPRTCFDLLAQKLSWVAQAHLLQHPQALVG